MLLLGKFQEASTLHCQFPWERPRGVSDSSHFGHFIGSQSHSPCCQNLSSPSMLWILAKCYKPKATSIVLAPHMEMPSLSARWRQCEVPLAFLPQPYRTSFFAVQRHWSLCQFSGSEMFMWQVVTCLVMMVVLLEMGASCDVQPHFIGRSLGGLRCIEDSPQWGGW